MAHSRHQPIRPLIYPKDNPQVAYVILTQSKMAIIDIDDAPRVGTHNWYAQKKSGREIWYAARNQRNNARGEKDTVIWLHKFILGVDNGTQVDHIFGNTLDDRKSELRLATHAQNAWNRKIMKNNKSGYPGVCWVTRENKYQAYCHKKFLGYYDNKEDAYAAYLKEADVYFGEFRRVNP